MPDPDPRAFIAEYVEPAIAAFRADQTVKHLAAHALAQVDILAAVVANHQELRKPPGVKREDETAFRKALEARIPVLTLIHDAHDAHKHGWLRVATRNFASGFDPESTIKYGIFADVSFADGPPTAYLEVVLTLADGSEMRIDKLLLEAMMAWEDELSRLGI